MKKITLLITYLMLTLSVCVAQMTDKVTFSKLGFQKQTAVAEFQTDKFKFTPTGNVQFWIDDLRVYTGASLTITPLNSTTLIQKALIVDTEKKPMKSSYFTSGTYDEQTHIWTSSKAEGDKTILIKASAQVRIVSIEFTYTESNDSNQVSAPVLSHTSCEFTDPFKVALSCPTEGASIHYTLDGTAPTATSTLYADSIQINIGASIQLRAIAVKNNIVSTESKASYTYVAPQKLDPYKPELQLKNNRDFLKWGQEYKHRTITYDYLTIDFRNADRQTITITDIPVLKGKQGNDVVVTLNDTKKVITSVTFVCRQWNTESHTLTISAGTTAETLTTVATGQKDQFTLTTHVPANSRVVSLSLSGLEDKVGLESLSLTLVDKDKAEVEVASLAEFIEVSTADRNTDFTIKSTLSVSYIHDKDIYLQDSTAALMAHNADAAAKLHVGDQLTNLVARYDEFINKMQLGIVTLPEPVPGQIQPDTVTVDTITEDMLNRYVTISEVEFLEDASFATNDKKPKDVYVSDLGGEYMIKLRSHFGNIEGIYKAGDRARLTGLVSIYKEELQINLLTLEKTKEYVELFKPAFSEKPGIKFEPFKLTITTKNEGAGIIYSVNSRDTLLYTEPLLVDTTIQLSAWTVLGGDTSEMSYIVYTLPEVIDVPNLAEFKTQATASPDSYFRIGTQLTTTYINDPQVFLQDSTGGIQIYDKDYAFNLRPGDKLNGVISRYSDYNGQIQLKPENQKNITEGDGTFDVFEVKLSEITTGMIDSYVHISNLTMASDAEFNFNRASAQVTDGDTTITITSQYKNIYESLRKGDKVDVRGIISGSDGNLHINIVTLVKTIYVTTPEELKSNSDETVIYRNLTLTEDSLLHIENTDIQVITADTLRLSTVRGLYDSESNTFTVHETLSYDGFFRFTDLPKYYEKQQITDKPVLVSEAAVVTYISDNAATFATCRDTEQYYFTAQFSELPKLDNMPDSIHTLSVGYKLNNFLVQYLPAEIDIDANLILNPETYTLSSAEYVDSATTVVYDTTITFMQLMSQPEQYISKPLSLQGVTISAAPEEMAYIIQGDTTLMIASFEDYSQYDNKPCDLQGVLLLSGGEYMFGLNTIALADIESSPVEQVDAPVSVFVNDGIIYVHAEPGAIVQACTIQGYRIYSSRTDTQITAINPQGFDVLLLQVNKQIIKVAVR